MTTQPSPDHDEATITSRRKKLGLKTRAAGLSVNWEGVNLDDIDIDDLSFQYRLSTSIGHLRHSLELDGQEEPIDLLRGISKPYRIIDGFRRCKAARELGMTTIKAFIHDMDEETAMRFAFTKNVERKNFAPMDCAHALWLAQRKGYAVADLTRAFGVSTKQVARYLRLLQFPEPLQRCIDGKVVTMAHAKVLADCQVENPSDWKDRIEAKRLSAKALKSLLLGDGKLRPGRKRQYVKQTKDSLRIYPFSVTKDTPREERDRIATVLLGALKFLERSLE